VFRWIQAGGNVADREMYRTLNCGVGMVICVPASEAENALAILKDAGEAPWVIGQIADAAADEEQVELVGLGA
jgi:phosphoribosylformylglycinamidine cyclo-ligase